MAVVDVRQDLGRVIGGDMAFELGNDEAESGPGESGHGHDAGDESGPIIMAP